VRTPGASLEIHNRFARNICRGFKLILRPAQQTSGSTALGSRYFHN